MGALVMRSPEKKSRLFLSLLFFLSFIAACPLCDAAPSVTHIFLIQNSGWMEPFYTDPSSKFKEIITEAINKLQNIGRPPMIACFNQSLENNPSPVLLYEGNDPSEAHRAVKDLILSRKPNSKAFTDTDFMEALTKAITEYSPGHPAVIWIFTNNKNSPHNSLETAEKNTQFYQWVQSEKNITRIAAYSFPMIVQGQFYKANGMMVYAIAYGSLAETELKGLIDARIPFDYVPARLKPLNADAVTFVPKGVARQSHVRASLEPDRNTLVLDFESSDKPESALIYGVFRNDFFPYDIRFANVSLNVAFQGDARGIRAAISPNTIANVEAGKESMPITVQIQIPPLPGIFSHPEIIFKNGYFVTGQIEFSLTNQELVLSRAFQEKMEQLFPGDPLPDIFIPGDEAKESHTVRPIFVRVSYPAWPLILLATSVLLVLALGLFLTVMITKVKRYTVVVNGSQKSYAIKAFGACPLYSDQGEKIGILRRKLGRPTFRLDQGRTDKVSVL